MSYLAPGGDIEALARYCGIKALTVPIQDGLLEDAEAAEMAVVAACGPVVRTSATHALRGPQAVIVTRWRPSELVSFVGADGTTLVAADLVADGQLVTRADGGSFPAGVLTYWAGWADGAIPADLVTVGRQIARQLWRSRAGNPRAEGEPGVGVLWPTQAALLAEPYRLAPLGFA